MNRLHDSLIFLIGSRFFLNTFLPQTSWKRDKKPWVYGTQWITGCFQNEVPCSPCLDLRWRQQKTHLPTQQGSGEKTKSQNTVSSTLCIDVTLSETSWILTMLYLNPKTHLLFYRNVGVIRLRKLRSWFHHLSSYKAVPYLASLDSCPIYVMATILTEEIEPGAYRAKSTSCYSLSWKTNLSSWAL